MFYDELDTKNLPEGWIINKKHRNAEKTYSHILVLKCNWSNAVQHILTFFFQTRNEYFKINKINIILFLFLFKWLKKINQNNNNTSTDYRYVILCFLFVLVSFYTYTCESKLIYKCQNGFSKFGSTCYFMSTTTATWQEAYFECKYLAKGSKLIVISKELEDHNIRKFLKYKKKGIYY